MKLKRIYLQAFGKFMDTTFDFSPKINLVYGNNEAGKSTIGEFIFSMLYGQKRYGVKKRIYLDSYKKYMPWHHSLYKGILHYSLGEDLYRIDRTFHNQNEEIEIFNDKTGQKINALYKIDVRKELQFLLEQIGLNQNNFKNTIYVTQNDMEGHLHKNNEHMLEELLGKIVYGIDGENGQKTASEIVQELEKTKKKIGTINSKNKPLGNTYKKLQEKLRRKYAIESQIQSYYDDQKYLQHISTELDSVKEKKTTLEAQKNYLDKKNLENKIHKIEKLLNEKQELKDYINKNFPIDIQNESIEGMVHERKRLGEKRKTLISIACITLIFIVLVLIWIIIVSLFWLQIPLMIFLIAYFIGSIIKWKNNVKNEENLHIILEKINRYQDSKKELNRLQSKIDDETSQYSLTQLNTKLDHLKTSPIVEVTEEKQDKYSIEVELEATRMEEINKIKEKSFIEAKIQKHDVSPLELEEIERDIKDLEKDIKDLEGDIQAIDIVIDTIKSLEENEKSNFLPYVIRKTEENIYKITKKYNTIKIDKQYEIKTTDPKSQKMIPLENLSQGTFNQFYFALRMSLVDALSPESIHLPIILDEPFVHFDNNRFEGSMKLLEELSENHQVIIFSSQKREKIYLDEINKDYNYIEL